MRSVYRWHHKVCREPELLLQIKTAANRYAAVEEHLRTHPRYTLPEIVQTPITDGSPAYLRWIVEQTR